jgi:hypothetical protein
LLRNALDRPILVRCCDHDRWTIVLLYPDLVPVPLA